MKIKNRIIPNVPKEERDGIEIGYHNLPNWLLYTFGVVIFAGISFLFYYS
jgi:hypothetical protein